MNNFLVTGGSGFIGSSVIKKMLEKGFTIFNIDLTPSKLDHRNLQSILGNIAHDSSYLKLNKFKIDGIIHLAAQTSARVSHENIELNNESNSLGTLKLIEWAKTRNIKRFLFASSMAVYGEVSDRAFVETDELKPNSYYGISKLEGELALQIAGKSGLDATSFRLFNVYGPGQNLDNLKQGMLSIYLKFILDQKAINVTGSLQRYRDFIYVEDVVDAFLKAIDNKSTYGENYNVGSGYKTHVKELINTLVLEFGLDPNTYPVFEIENHEGDVFGSYSNCKKIEQQMGWKPKWSLNAGIKEMIEWAKSQRS